LVKAITYLAARLEEMLTVVEVSQIDDKYRESAKGMTSLAELA
jgi:hypothetical protein